MMTLDILEAQLAIALASDDSRDAARAARIIREMIRKMVEEKE